MNNGIAFATMTGVSSNKGKNKNRMVTCYKCKMDGHYSNKCDEEDTVKTVNRKG